MKRFLYLSLAAAVSLLATSCETVDYDDDADYDDDDGVPMRTTTVEQTRVMRY